MNVMMDWEHVMGTRLAHISRKLVAHRVPRTHMDTNRFIHIKWQFQVQSTWQHVFSEKGCKPENSL